MVKLLQSGDLSPDYFTNDDTNNAGGVGLFDVRPCDTTRATALDVAALDGNTLLNVCVEHPAGAFSTVAISLSELAAALSGLLGPPTTLLSTFGDNTGVAVNPNAAGNFTDEVLSTFGDGVGYVEPGTLANTFGDPIN